MLNHLTKDQQPGRRLPSLSSYQPLANADSTLLLPPPSFPRIPSSAMHTWSTYNTSVERCPSREIKAVLSLVESLPLRVSTAWTRRIDGCFEFSAICAVFPPPSSSQTLRLPPPCKPSPEYARLLSSLAAVILGTESVVRRAYYTRSIQSRVFLLSSAMMMMISGRELSPIVLRILIIALFPPFSPVRSRPLQHT